MRAIDPRLLRRARSVRVLLAADVVLGVVAALLVLAQAVLLARVVARSFDGASLAEVREPLILLVLVAVARAAATWGFEVAGRRAATDVLSDLRLDLVERRLRDRPAGLDGAQSAEVATVAVGGVDALETAFARYLPQVVLAMVVPVAVLVLVAAIDPVSAGVMLLTLPLVPVFMWLVGRYTERRTRERWQALTRLSTHFLDVVRGLPTLRAFNRAEAQAERIAEVGDRYRRATMGTLRVAFLSGAVLELAATLGIALVAVVVGVRLVEGGLGFEAGLTVLVLAPELYLPLRNLAAQYHASADGLAVVGPPPRPARGGAAARHRARDAPEPARRPRPARGRLVLVPGPGAPSSTASIWSSGPARRSPSWARAAPARARSPRSSSAWRTPTPAACSRDPSTSCPVTRRPGGRTSPGCRSGRRSSAGRSRTTSASATRRPTTVACGRPRSSPAPTASSGSCRRAMSTTVGDGGRELSAGEARRLALARAFLRDAPLLILDEPTANLDPASAELVGDAIDRIRERCTILLIAHRPELARRADRVVALTGGRLVEHALEAA